MYRMISNYDKVTDVFIESVHIKNFDLIIFKNYLGNKCKNDPLLYNCYEIRKSDEVFYKKYASIDFDFNKYEYFLETTGTEKDEKIHLK